MHFWAFFLGCFVHSIFVFSSDFGWNSESILKTAALPEGDICLETCQSFISPFEIRFSHCPQSFLCVRQEKRSASSQVTVRSCAREAVPTTALFHDQQEVPALPVTAGLHQYGVILLMNVISNLQFSCT